MDRIAISTSHVSTIPGLYGSENQPNLGRPVALLIFSMFVSHLGIFSGQTKTFHILFNIMSFSDFSFT